jgi:hypothetical protein
MATPRMKSLRWLAQLAVVGALGLAACGCGNASDTVEVSSSNRAAHGGKAERHVERRNGLLWAPLYTVEVHGFRAIDESGYDWAGSDEVFGLFDSTRGYAVRTGRYGDVDSGDFRRIGSQERCLAPQRILAGGPVAGWLIAPETRWDCRPSSSTGVAAPIGLTLRLYEDDPCSAFVPPACFNPFAPAVRDPRDDLIGRVEVTYTSAQLESRLREVGDVMVDKFTLGGPCGADPDAVCADDLSPDGPEYELTINIRLVREAPVVTPA